jgi:clan AA aspartic protease (TIGR02281 family)
MRKRKFLSRLERARKAIVVAVLFLFIAQPGAAENTERGEIVIVVLNNGGTLKGVITERIEEGVVINVGYGTVVLSLNDIKEIRTPEGDKKTAILREWRGHVYDTKKREKQRKKHDRAVRDRIHASLQEKEEIEEQARREQEHRIKFDDSSKITVEAVINGEVEAELLVDTGASKVLLPLKTVEELTDIGPLPDKKVTTKLADGTEREGTPITLKSIEVDGLKAENVEAITMEMEGQDGLLGMSFLSNFHMKIDTRNKELILKEK